jgi:hypothetical protein
VWNAIWPTPEIPDRNIAIMWISSLKNSSRRKRPVSSGATTYFMKPILTLLATLLLAPLVSLQAADVVNLRCEYALRPIQAVAVS